MHNISINFTSNTIRVCINSKQTYFSYLLYGGKYEAMQAAIRYRDSIHVSTYRLPYGVHTDIRNESGVVGVCMKTCRGEHTGWAVTWQEGETPDRKQKKKCFYFNHYPTENHCLKAAKTYREMEVLENLILPTPP